MHSSNDVAESNITEIQITNSEEIAGPEEVVKEAGEGEDEVREEGEKNYFQY